MKKFYKLLEEKISKSLNKCGYNVDNIVVTESNRPDLGEYQYNGAMSLAKTYHKNPVEIANELLKKEGLLKTTSGIVDVVSIDANILHADSEVTPKNNIIRNLFERI